MLRMMFAFAAVPSGCRGTGRTAQSVIAQFKQTVQPMAALHVRPTSKYADLILSGEQPLSRSVHAVLRHVRRNSAAQVMLS